MEQDIQPRPLELVFMGYNAPLTDRFLQQFTADNAEQVAHFNKARRFLVLTDGTRIKGVSPGAVQRGFDGYRFDQLILADDERELIYITAAREIEIVRASLALSCVPREYQILYYNVFALEPCRECGRPSEILHHEPGTMSGPVALCRDCHARANEKKPGATADELSEALTGLSRVFVEVGVNADAAAEAFRRVAETAREALSPEMEIALIRSNPSLSRFQKWRLARKIRKERTP